MIIRSAAPSELDLLANIYSEAFRRDHCFIDDEYLEEHLKNWRKMIFPMCKTFVAAADEAIAFISLCDEDIPALFVSCLHKRTGCGSRLVDHVKSCRPRLRLDVFAENKGAVKFYEAQKFRRIGELERYKGHRQLSFEWNVDA